MFQANQQIGNYRLIKRLGFDGAIELWLAEAQLQFLTKKVVVKLPLDEQVDVETIRQKAKLWKQASGHPNILPIIDANIYDGQVVIVSEYADGGSLFDKLKVQGKFSVKEATETTIGLLNGLDFLHQMRIIHGDIQPQNIILQDGTPRLTDFEFLRLIEDTDDIFPIVTDLYMAPEAFSGKLDVQTNIWSVGVILHQLLSGKLPFPQEGKMERIFAILTSEFSLLPYETPIELKEIVSKALAKNPENRYLSANAMREDLQKALVEIQNPDYVTTREVSLQPSYSDLMYPGALQVNFRVAGIIAHGADWGVSGSVYHYYATSDLYETVIGFYNEKFGKGELLNYRQVTWRFKDSYWSNKDYLTISVFPESFIALLSERADVGKIPENTKTVIIIYSA